MRIRTIYVTCMASMLASAATAAEPLAASTDAHANQDTQRHELREDETSDPLARNAVHLELGGSGVVYSLSYERYVAENTALRIGGMITKIGIWETETWLALPLSASYLGVATGSHALELGGGVTPMLIGTDPAQRGLVATAIAGYRYAPRDGGLLFRAAFTPLYGIGGGTEAVVPRVGVSIGYRF